MEAFIERLYDEAKELSNKWNKLEIFIKSDSYNNIEPIQQTLLSIQLDSMKTYHNCLIERLKWLTTSVNKE